MQFIIKSLFHLFRLILQSKRAEAAVFRLVIKHEHATPLNPSSYKPATQDPPYVYGTVPMPPGKGLPFRASNKQYPTLGEYYCDLFRSKRLPGTCNYKFPRIAGCARKSIMSLQKASHITADGVLKCFPSPYFLMQKFSTRWTSVSSQYIPTPGTTTLV